MTLLNGPGTCWGRFIYGVRRLQHAPRRASGKPC